MNRRRLTTTNPSAAALVRRCYSLRTLERFVDFFGLARLTHTTKSIVEREYSLVKTPLLNTVVEFDPRD